MSRHDRTTVQGFGPRHRPRSITFHSKWPYLVRNTVLYSSPSLIRMLLYAVIRSSLVNLFASVTRSLNSSISGSGYLLRMVILLRPRVTYIHVVHHSGGLWTLVGLPFGISPPNPSLIASAREACPRSVRDHS